jgi:predicted nucleotidyltransferase
MSYQKRVRKTGLKSEKLDKIMKIIYENPSKEFTVRELEKIAKLPRATISEYLLFLKSKKLLNQNSLLFKIKKINYYTEKIVSAGLIDYLISTLNPSCIILFGSIRKGESDKDSDIDIFIETPYLNKAVALNFYEKKLKHTIQLHRESNLKNLQTNLLNNVINGIKLYGSFKVR